MLKFSLLVLIFAATGAPALSQLAEAVSSKRLNFAYTFGNPDYVDLSSVGANVFAAKVDNQMANARNLKSFAINYRGWRLLDEFIVDPEFFWELDPTALKGRSRTVSYEKIAKYPSLVKRYKAIKPVGVNYIVCVNLYSTVEFGVSTLGTHQVCFRAQSYQMFWSPSRSGRAASYPGALLGWKEGISTAPVATRFTARDTSDVERLKSLVSRFERVSAYSSPGANTWLDIRWPDEAIDQIYEDFEEYEKEGKDLEKEYKEAKEEPKVAKRAQPLVADDEMAQPFEAVPKFANVFNENGKSGLITATGKKVYISPNNFVPEPLTNDGRFFKVSGAKAHGSYMMNYQVVNAAGRVVKIDGHPGFANIWRNGDGIITAYVDTGGPVAYKTVRCYSIWSRLGDGYYTPEAFSAFQAKDRQPATPLASQTSTSAPGRNVYEISADSRHYHVFHRQLEYILDDKMKVKSKKEVFKAFMEMQECK
jgi:hypothetical protein